ncbi:hypothetical protein TWF106_009111 [Orbilia oligospora]|uniref:Uncharacterized protein n=2 Tax=Orbilia oligospora TaxID=2813651 RepID=A0A6G1MBQ9_ORBOL|nr:hypothetical protein TWF788_009062 [Orbilia oligospora]KAF3207248.1 hypothetical protein TWF191_001076 [Orbilia oligospora]KAF3216423.1 hypothetical protein TWF679_003039 [Orbilia oligospora]KAF3227594.1 hypothetical protein TWF106_009111 [Orbilia oligospora]KAF3251088.1 hypothetical protein TWF192_005066 [Orbilia oligospora]
MAAAFPSRPGFVPGAGMAPSNPMPNGPVPVVLPPNIVHVPKSNIRILCVADVRGDLLSLNELAKKTNADYILHTGDFGFYDNSSIHRIAEKTLRHVAQYSPLLSEGTKKFIQNNPSGQPIKSRLADEQLSQLPKFLDRTHAFDVPVYTVWGACEDVAVLEKFRSGEYKIDKLHIIDEASSRLLDVGGVKLRLLGLGGAVVMHKLFDNGEGKTTIAGGQGTMWTTLLQMGELLDTANRVYDASETRLFLTHSSPAREGLLNALAVAIKADFSISAGLHFRYGSSYNEFSVNPTLDHYRGKLAASKASFNDVWETVKGEVMNTVAQNTAQKQLLDNALNIIDKMPSTATGPNPFGGSAPGSKGEVDESAFKNMWNFNLADASFGHLILDIENGRIGTEMRAQGFNFAHRTGKSTAATAAAANAAAAPTGPSGVEAPVQPTNQPTAPTQPATAPTPQITAPQTSAPARAPSAPRRDEPVKPATPINVPPRTRSATPSKPVAVEASVAPTKVEEPANGASVSEATDAGPKEELAEPKLTSPTPPPQVEGPSGGLRIGLYVTNITGSDKVRELFPESDRELIDRVEEKHPRNGRPVYYYVFFKNQGDWKPVLERLPKDLTTKGDRNRPFVKEIDDPNQGPGGAGPWRRGGGGMGRGRGDNPRSSASESEGPPGGGRTGGRGFGGGPGGRPPRGDRNQPFEGRGGGRGNRGGNRRRDGQPDLPSSSTPA